MTENEIENGTESEAGFRLLGSPSGKVRHCKVVATLGPASSSEQTIRRLIKAGMNIARLNFSHGDHKDHLKTLETVRKVSRELGVPVGILQDLQGPKIRVGQLKNGEMILEKGKTYGLQYGKEQTDPNIIPIDYRGLVHDVTAKSRVMMDDGLFILRVDSIRDDIVEVTVDEGGLLKNRKGVNFPDSKLSLPAMTEKDSKDLLFGIANRMDFVALSFVQDASDVEQIKGMIKALGSDMPVIAKIEKLPALEQIDAIAKISDGLMVARGDLGVEGNVERVPMFQRKIITAAARYKKSVIIATQMLDSMIRNSRPTLAEMADVANGVLDKADCLMLSGEVANGKYPVESVERMVDIIEEVEGWTLSRSVQYDVDFNSEESDHWREHESIAVAACEAANALNAKALVCLTLTGSIARTMSQWRPKSPIIAISPRKDVVQRLSLVWGVYGIPNPSFYNTDVLVQELPVLLKRLKIVRSGDIVVITAGIPINQMRSTNMVKVHRIP